MTDANAAHHWRLFTPHLSECVHSRVLFVPTYACKISSIRCSDHRLLCACLPAGYIKHEAYEGFAEELTQNVLTAVEMNAPPLPKLLVVMYLSACALKHLKRWGLLVKSDLVVIGRQSRRWLPQDIGTGIHTRCVGAIAETHYRIMHCSAIRLKTCKTFNLLFITIQSTRP